MDIADKAEELEQQQRDIALKNMKTVHVQATDDCIECGHQISSERQLILAHQGGTDMCAMCAGQIEEDNKRRYGRY